MVFLVDKKAKKNNKAKEVAEAMVANMAANMADPNFLDDHERMQDEAARKVIEKRKLREKEEETE